MFTILLCRVEYLAIATSMNLCLRASRAFLGLFL